MRILPRSRRRLGLALLAACSSLADGQASLIAQESPPCLDLVLLKPAPVYIDESVEVRVNQTGLDMANAPLLFLHVHTPDLDSDTVPPLSSVDPSASPQTASRFLVVRQLDPSTHSTTLAFSRGGIYTLSLAAATQGWPATTQGGDVVSTCPVQEIRVERRDKPLPVFGGIRSHAWFAYRPLTQVELGSSIYFGRLGFASTVGVASAARINWWLPGVDVRWRGARGYLGGGLRYFPDHEPNRDRLRLAIVSGEELPAFKNHPVWLLLDVRLDDRHVHEQVWRMFTLSFAFRIDLTGDRP